MTLLQLDTTTIFSSVTVFLVFSLLLVGLILFAKTKLTTTGLVKLVINGQDTVEVEAGSSILSTLANK